MPRLTRDDGVELHWEERGEGPLVLLASYWSGNPSAHDPIADELAKDHHVVRYDARPDLVRAVVGPGSAPVSMGALQGADALVTPTTVINAFIEMMKTDYRGVLRTLLTQTNPQMEESEVRERVVEQAEYCPAETAVARAEAWFGDDSVEAGRSLGDRLVILYSDNKGGDWLPPGDEMAEALGGHLPEARLVHIADGIVTRPDLAAGVIRDLESR